MSLAERSVYLRQKRKLTQKGLAKTIGVHCSHMSCYERGFSLPSVEVVKLMGPRVHLFIQRAPMYSRRPRWHPPVVRRGRILAALLPWYTHRQSAATPAPHRLAAP